MQGKGTRTFLYVSNLSSTTWGFHIACTRQRSQGLSWGVNCCAMLWGRRYKKTSSWLWWHAAVLVPSRLTPENCLSPWVTSKQDKGQSVLTFWKHLFRCQAWCSLWKGLMCCDFPTRWFQYLPILGRGMGSFSCPGLILVHLPKQNKLPLGVASLLPDRAKWDAVLAPCAACLCSSAF